MKNMISVTILVQNGERRIQEVLEALKDFDEVLIYDTGSTDQTLSIAGQFPNVRIMQKKFEGFGLSHNNAASLAKHDWILSLDADEVLSQQLAEEIQTLSLDANTVYALPFHNYYNGKLIKWCGWYPEKHIRLYNRQRTQFTKAMVHEGVEKVGMQEATLRHPVRHYSYDSISDFLTKMERYSTLFAEQYKGKRKATPLTAVRHGAGAFFKSYLLKKGFLGGYEGFLISAYNSHTALYKYLKLYRANKEFSTCSSP